MLIGLLLVLFTRLAINARTPEDRVREAMTAAVRERMGAAADVAVDDLAIESGIDAEAIIAIPEPDSRLSRVVRFTLRAAGEVRARSGFATARIRVSVPHAHAAHGLDRGVELAETDLTPANHAIETGPLRALPTMAAAAEARTLRPIAQDACVTASAIAALPAVRGGRDVVAIARIDGVEAKSTLTAAENGDPGAVIRVVNRQTKRALKARVVSAGLVEIIHD